MIHSVTNGSLVIRRFPQPELPAVAANNLGRSEWPADPLVHRSASSKTTGHRHSDPLTVQGAAQIAPSHGANAYSESAELELMPPHGRWLDRRI